MEQQMNILVVDDEEVMCHLLYDVLTDIGYKVETAPCGEDAIEKIKEYKFSIIITDFKMPGMDGIEVLKRVKAINQDICVIMITAYSSVESVIAAMHEGVYDYIVKPFNINEINIVVRRAAERQRLLSDARQKEFYQEQAILDGLTGLYNRRHLYDVLSREIERAKRYKQQVSLLMIDIDDFKKYNDTYGHPAGDKLLQSFSEVTVGIIRAEDMVFRYGGEEFTIICPGVPKEGVITAAKRLISLIREKVSVGISIGISSYPDDGQSKEELISKADLAMYHAKHSGKSRICVYGAENEY